MTREQAFKEWMAAANNHCYCSEDIWNAACDWQKQQDAKEIKQLQEYEWMYKDLCS